VPPDDFFDGEWEEPSRTQDTAPTRPVGEPPGSNEPPERVPRDRGRPRRGGGGGPIGRPPGLPSLEGLEWGRLGLLAAGIIVLVLMLLLAARSCGGSSATSKNRDYFDQVKKVLATSDRAGQQLHDLFHSQQPIRSKAAIKKLESIKADAQSAVVDAQKLKPTKQVEALQPWLIEALTYRVNGIDCMIQALPQAYKEKRPSDAGAHLVPCTRRLLASDVIYTDSFYASASKALQADNIDVSVPTSTFLVSPDDQITLNAAGMGGLLQHWKPGSVAHGLHGLKLDTVVARAADGTTVTLQSSTLTPVKATGLSFLVTATNGGNFPEFDVPVKITIGSGSTKIVKTATINSIAKGKSETVTISGFSSGSNLQFGKPVTMKVEVVPVPGEHNASNNSQTFQITFSL
jgi:hypothetical protein